MKEIAEAITRISGHRGRRFYTSLIHAIYVAKTHMPTELLMKDICQEAGPLCGKEPSSVSQDASRAIRDIWEFGDRPALAALLKYEPKDIPTPKDFIIEVAELFWTGRA